MIVITIVGKVKDAKVQQSAKDPSKSFGVINVECQDGQYTTTVEVQVWGKHASEVTTLRPGNVVSASGKGGSKGWQYQDKTYSRLTVMSPSFTVISSGPSAPV